MNLDIVSFTATQPNTGASMTLVTGDPASIRNSRAGADILGIAAWTKSQSAGGFTQLLWPSGHDLVRGFRMRHTAADPINCIPASFPLAFKPQDPLTVTNSGSNTAGDVQLFHLMLWYEDLPGIDARLITPATLRKRGVQSLTIEDSITATAASTYSAARALNATSDLLKADTDYAVLGIVAGVLAGAITLRGPDSGNMRVGMPCNPTDQGTGKDWFVRLSEAHDLPAIPVFNSSNRAGTFIEVVQDENLTAVPFALNLVELSRGS